MKNATGWAELDQRSGCPINLTMEALGDRWSLVVLRDMMFGDFRYFRELMNNSMEGIASNILAARLKRLMELGFITAAEDPAHKQKIRYSLTERAIELLPVFVAVGAWGRKHLPVTDELSVRAELLEQGGPKVWAAFMDELRAMHLGAPKPKGPSVLAQLDAAYQAACKRKSRPKKN